MHFVVVPTAVSTELEIICGLVLIRYKHAPHGGSKLHSGKDPPTSALAEIFVAANEVTNS